MPSGHHLSMCRSPQWTQEEALAAELMTLRVLNQTASAHLFDSEMVRRDCRQMARHDGQQQEIRMVVRSTQCLLSVTLPPRVCEQVGSAVYPPWLSSTRDTAPFYQRCQVMHGISRHSCSGNCGSSDAREVCPLGHNQGGVEREGCRFRYVLPIWESPVIEAMGHLKG